MLDRRTLTAFGLFSALPIEANAQSATVAKLMEPGPLPEKSFGPTSATVTVIEYASVTCHHCMNFHINTWPKLKEKYVDTGKIRFIMREFPLDTLAAAGFMLARCSGDDKWYPVLDMLYKTQETWAHSQQPAEALETTMRQTGMSKQQFETCLNDQKLLDSLNTIRKRAAELGVDSTPTFFVNGAKHTGALTLEQFDKVLEPLL